MFLNPLGGDRGSVYISSGTKEEDENEEKKKKKMCNARNILATRKSPNLIHLIRYEQGMKKEFATSHIYILLFVADTYVYILYEIREKGDGSLYTSLFSSRAILSIVTMYVCVLRPIYMCV